METVASLMIGWDNPSIMGKSETIERKSILIVDDNYDDYWTSGYIVANAIRKNNY